MIKPFRPTSICEKVAIKNAMMLAALETQAESHEALAEYKRIVCELRHIIEQSRGQLNISWESLYRRRQQERKAVEKN